MKADPPAARLLVVDDDPVVTTLVCHLLTAAGFTVVSASTAALAWQRLEGEPFDLVLLDVGLPDQEGFSLCRDLKGRPGLRDLAVVFMTARGSEDELLRGFDVGGVDYVVKPFEPRVLLARVRTHTTLARLSRDLQSALDARTQSLRLARHRVQELDSELVLAEERERRRLADQLHDTTIQQLVLARILLDDPGFGDGSDAVGRLRGLLDSSLAQLRSLVFELSPPVLSEGGLDAGLQWLTSHLGACWRLHFAYRVEGTPFPLPDDVKLIVFQGARELMTNVCRHARAKSAEMLLEFADEGLRLTVSDDGIGIPAPGGAGRTRGDGGGFGLFSLRSRIELIGGSLDMRSGERGGTRATLRVPLRADPT